MTRIKIYMSSTSTAGSVLFSSAVGRGVGGFGAILFLIFPQIGRDIIIIMLLLLYAPGGDCDFVATAGQKSPNGSESFTRNGL